MHLYRRGGTVESYYFSIEANFHKMIVTRMTLSGKISIMIDNNLIFQNDE
jgi:hypothetical protein